MRSFLSVSNPISSERISSCVALWPLSTSASRSCCNVMTPRFSVSICCQICESSEISRSVRWCARTLSATFLSFDMPTKFWSRAASWSPLSRFLRWWWWWWCFFSATGLGGAAVVDESDELSAPPPTPPLACLTIHGCSRASRAVMRAIGSSESRFWMNALASAEMSSQSSFGNDRDVSPRLTRSKIATSESPLNGGYPQSRM
mmetsp:Transcript_18404/g.73540  ORF Transcript_18404/g.73540 Transcript_18404/m.73540 type:complete len:203 (-) Transcript_18404:843-1451(-)